MNFSVSTELCIDIFKKQRNWFPIAADHLQLNCNDLLIARDLAELAGDDSDEFLLLLLLLADAVNKGSLCLLVDRDSFAHQVSLLGADVELMREKARNIPAFFDKENPLLIFENGSLYFQKYYKNERLLEEHLDNLVKQQLPITSPEKISAVVDEVISSMKYSLEPLQIQAMLCSLLNSFSIISGGPGTGKTTIMVAILRSLLRLGHKIEDIQLAAPTGRAAKRMTEAVRQGIGELEQQDEVDQQILSLEAGTLHRLLGAGPEGFNYHSGNKISAKVIVIDEVSMVDISLMNSFLQALPEDGCRLIFLGDQFQLPSVDAGAVLADLMPPTSSSPHFSASFKRNIEDSLPLTQMKFSEERREELLAGMTVVDEAGLMGDRVTVLAVSKRCQKDIAAFSEIIKAMDVEKSREFLAGRYLQNFDLQWPTDEGLFLLPAENTALFQWKNIYQSWIEQNFFSSGKESFQYLVRRATKVNFDELDEHAEILGNIFKHIYKSRILCILRQGPFGADNLNQHIGEFVRRRLAVSGSGARFHGSIIMVSRNDRALNLYNGDTGILLKDDVSGELRAVFEDGDKFRSHSIHNLPPYKSAFAMTVHKSQGSEFECILMPLPDKPEHRLLSREILYTGLTRAKKAAFIFASDECLKAGIERQSERHSGLNFWG